MSLAPELDDYKPKVDKEPHKPIRSALLKDKLDLGFCPINQTTSKTIELYNPNAYEVDFQILTQTITASPNVGLIPAKTKVQLTLQFTPKEAIAITEKLVLNISEEESRITQISAIGKYPYLSVDQEAVQFDSKLVGDYQTRQIIIKNCSQVPARFNIFQIKDDDFKDNSFALDCYNGEIAAQDKMPISITYKPQVVGLTSVAHYKINCPGGNEVVFECVGQSKGYDVHFNTNSINFGEIKIGDQTSRLLTIHNDSDLPMVYQFYNDAKNIFGLSRNKGRVKPHSYERIIVNFVPSHTICYYERIYCIIRNHQLLNLDLIGTCYDLLIKPLPLLQKHIDAFRRRVVSGKLSEIDFRYMENAALMKLSHTMSPNKNATQNYELGNSFNQSKISQDMVEFKDSKVTTTGKQQAQNKNASILSKQNIVASSYIPDPAPNQIVLHKEAFQPPNDATKLMMLSEELIDFNFCDFQGQTITKELVVQNRMACKMTVFWTIQKHDGINGQKQVVFQVHPETASLKPYSNYTFQVTFKPAKSQYYFFQNLQFFAFKYSAKLTKKILEDAQKQQSKTLNNSVINALKGTLGNTSKMKSEDITADETIPPYSGSIKCVGHSFGSGSQPYIPILEVLPSNKVNFAACSREESLYQTVEVHNTSDTPTYFRFSPDVDQIFRVYPNAGLIAGKSFVVIVFEFTPKEFKAYNTTISCHLNHNTSNTLNFHVHGYASEPELSLQNSGKIYFPPSYTGVYSRQKVKVQNLSRIQLYYNISIPEKYEEELYLEPNNGFIKPNETIFLDCSFVPYRRKGYKIKVPLQIKEVLDPSQNLIGYHLPGSGNPDKPLQQRTAKEVNYNFEIYGKGGDGSLSIEPQNMDFQIVKVNFNKQQYATLHNYSNCTFYIELKLRNAKKQIPEGTQHENWLQNEEDDDLLKNFTLDFTQGIIAANSKIDIGIMFNPTEIGEYNVILDVIAKEKNPMADNGETKFTKKLLCQKCSIDISAKGSYPMLKICDVRNVEISVATLWENFQINQINSELKSQLNSDEKQFLNIEQLNFTEAAALQKRLRSYKWNFGYLPNKQNVQPRTIVITIQNIGGTECDWQFKFPSDNQIEVEPWADPGEPTPEEAKEKSIIEREVFDIRPRFGTLAPNKYQDVKLTYSPGNNDEALLFNKKSQEKEHGPDELNVILQIKNGKPLVLKLTGMTLAPLEGRLAVKKSHYILPDTPIGLLEYVKVPIEIQNVGSSKISYRIDIVEKDKDGNNIPSKFAIFTVEQTQGSLQPNEKQYLYTKFRPLETKTYYHEIEIHVSDFVKSLQKEYIKVEGKGYSREPANQLANMHRQQIPSQRSHVSSIGSQVCFSIEEIDFGQLQPGKSAHRIIILYNLSHQNRLKFEFPMSGGYANDSKLTCGDSFEIDPKTSYLNPRDWCELKLTLTAQQTPSVYEGEIECIITWESRDEEREEHNNQISHVSQPSSALTPQKETLFLRIKKSSELNVELINSFTEQKPKELKDNNNDFDKHCFELIMERVIHEVINESKTVNIMNRIDEQDIQLYATFDDEEPPQIEDVSQGFVEDKNIQMKNFKDYRNLFLEDEFVSLVDMIMENTYFNIIQETTRGECDLSRISKTFVMPSNR